MSFSPLTRKAELVRADVSQRQVAVDCEVDESLVSHILAGRRWEHPAALKVMRYLAGIFGVPVSVAFPDDESADRRQGERRSA